jgi:protein-S-isoprenylcysteine O-methyltransferase Ste14
VSRLPRLGRRGEGWVVGQFGWLGLIVLLSLPDVGRLSLPEGGVRWGAVVLGGLGLAAGASLMGLGVFGLGRQVTPWPRPPGNGHMVEQGVYRFIRHPIYAGAISLGVGWACFTGSLASLLAALGLAAWMDLKARREEAWLLDRYPGYGAYRARSHRFVPGVY